MQTYVTQCVTHPEQSSPHVSTIERSVGWTRWTRGNQAVFRAQAMFAMFTTRPHTWFQWGYTHTRIAWATMGLATVRRPLVTPFWGLSIVEVINTYLHFVFLSFLLDPFSHLRVLKRRQSWDNRFGTLWWISVHLYMKWCIWLLRFWLGIGKILYFLGGTLWWVESGH